MPFVAATTGRNLLRCGMRWLSNTEDVDRWQPELADPNGLLAVGGDLRPERVLAAYRAGVFPWYAEGNPICWWSPDPRAIIEFDQFHVPRRLGRTMRSGRFVLTINADFGGVIRGCADRLDGTWITPEMMSAYETLHEMGYAHSVEVWENGILAGGIYGVANGGLFAGESMFSRRRDASKVALAFVVTHLQRREFRLFDIQFRTDHTERLGAITISRKEYLARLRQAVADENSFAV
jgi:leucyl/phenylalanyl-tRNA--protein transferase